MLELAVIPILIIFAIVYSIVRKAYASQIFTIIIFVITVYLYILLMTSHDNFWMGMNYPDHGSTYYSVFINSSFVPARLFQIEHIPSIFTSMFLHISPMHLIGNLLFLYLLGMPLEERIGTKKWILLFFVTGMGGTFTHYAMNASSNIPALGVSGVIFGLGGALLALYPKDTVVMPIPLFFIMIIRPVKVWIAVGLMFGIETFITLMYPQNGVGHYAHLGGAITGILAAYIIVGKRQHAAQKEKLNYEILRHLAITGELKEALRNIEGEEQPDVKNAWLDHFFNIAKCPNCQQPLEKADTIKCGCGKTYKIMK